MIKDDGTGRTVYPSRPSDIAPSTVKISYATDEQRERWKQEANDRRKRQARKRERIERIREARDAWKREALRI